MRGMTRSGGGLGRKQAAFIGGDSAGQQLLRWSPLVGIGLQNVVLVDPAESGGKLWGGEGHPVVLGDS